MSIAISMKINDGIVLASDSASTLIGKTPDGQIAVINTYNNANKVFNLRKGLPIGLVTWGAGSIGTNSISTLTKDLRKRFTGRDGAHHDWKLDKDNYSVEHVATRVRSFMYEECYVPAFADWIDKPVIGFIVSGYSSDAEMGDEYLIEVSKGQCPQPTLLRPRLDSGVTWGGVGEALNRLIMGFGTLMPQVLQNNIHVPPEKLPEAMQALRSVLAAPLIIPAMPLQDAIDLTEFMVDLTVKWVRFGPGPPTVAGPIEIAAISKHEGFRWIKRKYYFDKELNPQPD